MSVGEGLRPRVTLSWAQSIDGSVAARRGGRTRISGGPSLAATHRLRSEHDAILVGIGTVLADDPRLDVRLVPGSNPRPVILDARLRTPTECALVGRSDVKPLIFASSMAAPERRSALSGRGCEVIEVACDEAGHLDLGAVLEALADMGLSRLMVEGGGRIIASFLAARLVDRVAVTIGPVFLGGYNPFADPAPVPLKLSLSRPRIEVLGEDVLIDGEPLWGPT